MNARPLTRATSDGVLAILTLMAAYLVKRHYSLATCAELEWILRPTAKLAGFFCGSSFERTHEGYANAETGTIIVPACAGVNYFIIAFSMLSTAFVGRFTRLSRKVSGGVASAAVAYVVTVWVNAIRISFGVFVHHHAFAGVVSPEEAHRVEGVVVYLSSLWLLYRVADRATAPFAACARVVA